MRHCDLCRPREGPRGWDRICLAHSDRFGIVCTRPLGHDGDHAACGAGPDEASHPLRTWPATVGSAKEETKP